MYESDSFFTLSVGGQIGLALLSLWLSVLVLWALWRGTRGLPRLSRLGAAYLGFWLFVWLSPQVYYQYYRLIFDGLPVQWGRWTPGAWRGDAAVDLYRARDPVGPWSGRSGLGHALCCICRKHLVSPRCSELTSTYYSEYICRDELLLRISPMTERDRPWLIRTYAGHSTAAASNALYRGNLAKGQTGAVGGVRSADADRL